MHLRHSLLIISIISAPLLFAQKSAIKFGKVSLDELEMTHYQEDSSAGAVMLYDYGNSKIVYNQTAGFQIVFERTTRIKIFNKSEYDWANVEIPLYRDGSNKETVSGLKGYTYNLVNGKTVSSKLDKKSIYDEKISDNRSLRKFALPNVKEGSVIEYTYRVTSDFLFNFFDWEFQKTIPVAWSEYNTQIPEYFHYQKVTQGYLPFTLNEKDTKASSISFTNKTRTGGNFSPSQTNYSTSKVNYTDHLHRLVIMNAPAFKEEPYMTTHRNYISKIIYELSFTRFPNQQVKNYMGDWQKLNKEFLSSSDFGTNLKGYIAMNKVVENLLVGIDDPLEQASVVYNHVRNKIIWDKNYGTFLHETLGKAYDTGKGDVVQINLLLANMLRKADLIAEPVLVSTRNHGVVRPQFPLATQFNYVICKVTIGDSYYLLDATDRLVPFGALPQRCLNGKGWVVSKENSGWVDLESSIKTGSKVSGKITINERGNLSGNLKKQYLGYSGYSERGKYFKKGESKFKLDKVNSTDWIIEDFSIENPDQLASDFIENYEFEIDENLNTDMIYLDPILMNEWHENPFKLESRSYPIDFASPISNLYYVTMTIPEGYIIEELPESVAFSLPNNAGKFVYQISQNNNNIVVMCKLDVTKTLYVPSEYDYVKTFFAHIVTKQQEQIVLKRQ